MEYHRKHTLQDSKLKDMNILIERFSWEEKSVEDTSSSYSDEEFGLFENEILDDMFLTTTPSMSSGPSYDSDRCSSDKAVVVQSEDSSTNLEITTEQETSITNPKKRKPLSQQAREERNRRRRVIPSVKLPFQRVRILKNDIRRSYPAMINNVINSGDLQLISKFFLNFAAPSLVGLNITPELSTMNAIPVIHLKGAKELAACWIMHQKYIPDGLFLMDNVIIKVNPITNESVLVGRGTMKGTKVFDDELPPIIQTLRSYLQHDILQIIRDHDGKLQVSPKVKGKGEVLEVISSEVETFINSPLPVCLYECCNLPKPALQPMAFEVTGEFRISLNSHGKMIRSEFFSPKASTCYRELTVAYPVKMEREVLG